QARVGEIHSEGLMRELLETEVTNLRTTVAANSAADIDQCVKIIEDARRIFVIGRRSFFPAAYLFHFSYSMYGDNAHLVADQGGSLGAPLSRVTNQDV